MTEDENTERICLFMYCHVPTYCKD